MSPFAEQRDIARVSALMELYDHAVFVFGSNLRGRHGAGAALAAVKQYGAEEGQGVGQQGRCYAIPTKDRQLQPLSLDVIGTHVRWFLGYASRHASRLEPGYALFAVSRIGCGLAGFDDEEIAPLFKGAPPNCELPVGWRAMNGEVEGDSVSPAPEQIEIDEVVKLIRRTREQSHRVEKHPREAIGYENALRHIEDSLDALRTRS